MQANLYTAFFRAWNQFGDGTMKGAIIWVWDPNTAQVGPGNGADFSPQGLPAAGIIKANFSTLDFSESNVAAVINLTTQGGPGTLLFGIERLIGSSLADRLTGDAAANVINGGRAADVMTGIAGNDIYFVDHASDRVIEAAGRGTDRVLASVSYVLKAGQSIELFTTTNNAGGATLKLTGNEFANNLIGNAGANVLTGGAGGNDILQGRFGNDTLVGGTHRDILMFNTALNPTRNVDTIKDFSVLNDTIRLDNAIFSALTKTGPLAASAFHVGAAAHDGNDHIIHNRATGALIYDFNGDDPGGAVRFAMLTQGLALTRADFVVI